jgi:hypothetical protein
MKIFTIEEANELLPIARPILLRMQKDHEKVMAFRESAKSAAKVSAHGSGVAGSALYVNAIMSLSEATGELDSLGIQIKDFSRGLIDFPCMREGRVVLLCWQLGEGDEIEWWHDVDAGFSGRQRL